MNDATYWNALSRDLTNDPDKLRRDFMQEMTTAAVGPREERAHEAIHGICIAAEDREWPTEGSLEDDIPGDYFAGVPMPNPISQEDDPS